MTTRTITINQKQIFDAIIHRIVELVNLSRLGLSNMILFLSYTTSITGKNKRPVKGAL